MLKTEALLIVVLYVAMLSVMEPYWGILGEACALGFVYAMAKIALSQCVWNKRKENILDLKNTLTYHNFCHSVNEPLDTNIRLAWKTYVFTLTPAKKKVFNHLILVGQLKRISCKQGARWQYLSLLIASAFFSLQKNCC